MDTVASRRSERDLLTQLQRGDNDAWTELAQTYSPRLYAYLRHSLPSSVDAEDALSETLLAAVRALPTFDGNVTLSTFLYALAYRKMVDFWRRRSPTVELQETVTVSNGSGGQAEFEELFNKLPELLRQVLWLRYQVGFSVSEIAEVIDRSYKGTESLLSRARGRLRDVLDQASVSND